MQNNHKSTYELTGQVWNFYRLGNGRPITRPSSHDYRLIRGIIHGSAYKPGQLLNATGCIRVPGKLSRRFSYLGISVIVRYLLWKALTSCCFRVGSLPLQTRQAAFESIRISMSYMKLVTQYFNMVPFFTVVNYSLHYLKPMCLILRSFNNF